MVISQLRHFQLATSGVQLVLFAAAAQMESRSGWLLSLPLIALISVFAWLSALKKYRTIADTPTSKIASAAQGYVELMGRADRNVEQPLLQSQLGRQACVWFRYSVERRDNDGDWQTVDCGESDTDFLLRDDSGVCHIQPTGAEILSCHKKVWIVGAARHSEWWLLEGDPLYVLGDFKTSQAAARFDAEAETGAMLVRWKQNMPQLQLRFDLNGDGVLDEHEWMLARQAARQEVEKIAATVQTPADVHVLQRPENGAMFVISNLMPAQLARHYLRWVWGNLLLFFVAVIGLAFVLQQPDF